MKNWNIYCDTQTNDDWKHLYTKILQEHVIGFIQVLF